MRSINFNMRFGVILLSVVIVVIKSSCNIVKYLFYTWKISVAG